MRINTEITKENNRLIRQIKEERGMTLSQIVNIAIDNYIRTYKPLDLNKPK